MREMKDSGIEWIGEIPKDWHIKRAKYLFEIASGSTPNSDPNYWDGSVVWVTPADFKTEDKYIHEGKRTISLAGLKSCSCSLVPKYSLVFSKRAPIGTVAINSVPLCTNQGCLTCVPYEKDIHEYYYYVLSCGREHFEILGSGTTFKEISISKFSNCELPVPPCRERDLIVSFLNLNCQVKCNTTDSRSRKGFGSLVLFLASY